MAVNLKEKLIQAKTRSVNETDILAAVEKILADNEHQREIIRQALENGDESDANPFVFDLLESERIFHISHIKKLCVNYRLRFLESKMFKHQFPEEAVSEIRKIECDHNTSLSGFRVVAPTKAFHLLNYNDPLLFAPIGNGYYYLIHQWGNDLNSWRKWQVWPFRNIGTFTLMCLVLSVFATMLFPLNKLGEHLKMASVIVFLFAFKSVFAVLMYGFFMGGRKFSAQSWDSRYYNN
ncbi:MAG: hypothetical protein EOO48_01260 [Flavobacterium sp.]|nr:MAG: hypothetical protein EOO48_01260 [Flavobacterium sp.]